MSRRIALAGVLAAASVWIAGCQAGSYRSRSGPRFTLGLELDREVLVPGDTLSMRVTLFNARDELLELKFPDSCQFGYRIEDYAGNVAVSFPGGCYMAPTALLVRPGEAVVRDFAWTRDDEEVEPGPYRVFAGLGRGGLISAAEGAILLKPGPVSP